MSKEYSITDYKILKKIGSGSFGRIYICISPAGEPFALKCEKRVNSLSNEYKIYTELSFSHFIPRIYAYGKIDFGEGEEYGMVMDLLGLSLQDLFLQCNKKFSIKTVMMLAQLMISRVEYLHHKNIIHRDIKPDNFMFGKKGENESLYIIDFGLSKYYRDRSYMHIPYKKNKNLTGTARYASINIHDGIEGSRRDDLESLAYCLIYFAKGSLPWQGQKGRTKSEKYTNIKNVKKETTVYELCEDLPRAFSEYLHYVRNLKFDEMPNYIYLKDLFANCMKENMQRFDYKFDWMVDEKMKIKEI